MYSLPTTNSLNNWNSGHERFRASISKYADVVFVGPGFDSRVYYDAALICEEVKPDVVATYGMKYSKQFTNLRQVRQPKVHFLCDYISGFRTWPGTLVEYDELLVEHQYDFFFCHTKGAQERLNLRHPNVKSTVVPFGADIDYFCSSEWHHREWDVSVS